jgi:putative ABC transport system permease protein
VPVERIAAPEGARWALDGDRGITAAPTLPDNSALASGAWWPADYAGEPLVSFEDELAHHLDLHLGDRITVSVLGRSITARLANTRRLEWASLSINFVMVFSPNTIAGAPYSLLSTVALHNGGDRVSEAKLLKAVVDAFPTATVVRVKDVLATVGDLVGSLIVAVRAAASITLLSVVLVLSGALASGHRRRLYDAVLLKTLGATRARVLAAFVAEYALIGVATALFALLAGSAAAAGVLHAILDVPPVFDLGLAVATVLAALVFTIGLGLAATYTALGAKAGPVLRDL